MIQNPHHPLSFIRPSIQRSNTNTETRDPMFGKKKKPRQELQYTCNRCQHVQYRSLASRLKPTKPNRAQLAGARMQVAGNRMTLGGGRKQAGAELTLSKLERQLDAYNNWKAGVHCDQCGSSSMTCKTVDI